MQSSISKRDITSNLDFQVAETDTPDIYVCPLDDHSLIEVTGADAERFLQGQLSCDLAEINLQGSRLGSHCSIKGSILSLYRVFNTAQGYQLRLRHDNYSDAIDLLKKYIIFSKAEISDLSSTWIGFGVGGETAPAILAAFAAQVPVDVDHCITTPVSTLTKVSGERFELWLTLTEAEKFLATLPAKSCYETSYWCYQEIINAIPEIASSSKGLYIPQMCNLQAFAGISFKKGCYTGQEVITRLQFRGKLTKYLITARIETSAVDKTPCVGDQIDCDEKENVGQLLQVIQQGNDWYLQIIINKKYDSQPLRLKSQAKAMSLTVLKLPYDLDPELFNRKS